MVLFHILAITNIDNVLRPILVPKEARLDPALMLLSVFSGIAMFGFFGIILGPVLMILIVTTIAVYLDVYKGVEMEQPGTTEERKKLFGRGRKSTARDKQIQKKLPEKTPPEAAEGQPAEEPDRPVEPGAETAKPSAL